MLLGLLLRGAVVQRVDLGRLAGRDAAVIRVRVPGETLHVFVVAQLGGAGPRDAYGLRDGAVALLAAPGDARAAMRGEGRHRHEAKWRAALEGARVGSVRATRLVLEKGTDLIVIGGGDSGVLEIATAAGGVPHEEQEPDADAHEDDEAALRATLLSRGLELTSQVLGNAFEMRRVAVVRAITKASARLARRVEAIGGDLSRIGAAEDKATLARLFVAEAARAVRGAKDLSVVDWSSGEKAIVTMPLDPSRGAREQIDALFKRAKRLKDGSRIGHERLAQATAAIAKLREGTELAAQATTLAELESVVLSARATAGKDFTIDQAATIGAGKRRAKQAPLPSYRTFVAASGAKILVGRGAAQNDDLTLHVARPHDLWLHAKGRAGAHVIVPLAKGASCPSEVLVDAAHLAAHFSEERDETAVEVEYTPRRYLRKPRGSAPGLVIVDREKVLILRRDDATLRRLLESETSVIASP
jgi:hypothetical protein